MAQEDSNSNLIRNGLTPDGLQVARDGFDYEPSDAVKKSFLSRRKKTRTWAGINYPGLFDLFDSNDSGWFWFTVGMEVVSLGIAAFLLEERVSTTVLLISALSVFFLDFTFAYFHHKYKEDESRITNQMLLFLPEMRGGTRGRPYIEHYGRLDQELKDNINRKYMRYVFGFLIWMLSFLKGGIFFVAVFSSYWFQTAVIDSKAPYLLIVVILASYIWIAFNHLNYSGYYLAAFFSNRKYKSELARYKKNSFKHVDQNLPNEESTGKRTKEQNVNLASFLDEILREKDNPYLKYFTDKSYDYFESDIKGGIVEIRVAAGHFIKKSEDKEGNYMFFRKGFLTDRQVNDMVQAQKSELAKLAVAMHFHFLQMDSAGLTAIEVLND